MKKHITHSVSKQKSSYMQQKLFNNNHINANNAVNNRGNSHQRKCHTPSIMTQQQKKSKSRPARQFNQKLSQKKPLVYYSIKNVKPQASSPSIMQAQQQYQSNIPLSSVIKQTADKPSPFKHKYRKKSSHVGGFANALNSSYTRHEEKDINNNRQGITNARHNRKIQSQLSHLSNFSDSSLFRSNHHHNQKHKQSRQKNSSLIMGEGGSQKIDGSGNIHNKSLQRSKKHIVSNNHHETMSTIRQKEFPLLAQGKALMKSHKFSQGVKTFQKVLNQIESFISEQNEKAHNKSHLHQHRHNQQMIVQCHYLMGVCHFHLCEYQSVAQHLTQVIFLNSEYRKNVYLFLGIAHKKLFMIQQALLILGKALAIYPRYLDVLILRAKILSKQKRYYDAIQDLNACIKLQPHNLQAYISKADCLRNLTQFKQAMKIYTQILGTQSPNPDILLKRAITYIENEQIPEALSDLNRILSIQPKNSQAYLFKGLAYTKAKNYNDSILSYQQAIKFNTSKKATTKALYEIAKLKIEMGDFYGAAYTLERGLSLDIDMKVIQKLKVFVDGATFIMKKKYKRGIQLLNILGKKQHLNQMIRSFLYSFRAYGHFCLNKYASALGDLKQLIKSGFVLDPASQYNYTLLQGIMKCQNNEFAQSVYNLTRASELRKQFSDPIMYMALCKLSQYNRTPKLRSKSTHLLQQSLKLMLKALQKQSNFNYFYLIAIVYYILKQYSKALQNLEQAIQGSDVHILKHFYLRAMINAMLGRHQQCYTDLNNVLNVSKQLKEKETEGKQAGVKDELHDGTEFEDILNHQKQIVQVYLNRAKCHLIFDEKKKAFQDLQTYIAQKPMDSSIHTVAGKLLFSIDACQDAIKAFNYSPNIDKDPESLLSRLKCYIILKQLNLSLRDMQRLMQLGQKPIQFDYYCLGSLKEASKSQQENFKEALHKISQAQTMENKQGSIFTLSDLFFYKGVFLFMLKQYQNAKKYMKKSKNLKKLNNQLQILPQNKQLTEQQYESMFQNKIFTDKQIEYNIGICELMQGNFTEAYEYLQEYEKFSIIFNQEQQDSGQDSRNKRSNKNESQQEQPLLLTAFPISNRLCSIFPETSFCIKSQNINLRLSFDLPTVKSPPIIFQTQYRLIEQVSMSSMQSRPDAPWIKRNSYGVVFTTNQQLIKMEEDVDIKTDRSFGDQNQQDMAGSTKKAPDDHESYSQHEQHCQQNYRENEQPYHSYNRHYNQGFIEQQQQQQPNRNVETNNQHGQGNYPNQREGRRHPHQFEHQRHRQHQTQNYNNGQVNQHSSLVDVQPSSTKQKLKQFLCLDQSVEQRLNQIIKNKSNKSQ